MKQLLTTLTIFSISAVLFLACNNKANESGTNTATSEKSTFDLASAKKSIEEANTAFANFIKQGDSASVPNLYSSDAKVMGANMTSVTGKAAIQSTFAGFINGGVGGVTLTTVDVWGTESLVSEEGTYSLTDKTGKEIDKGKYIVLWKMEDGKWKLFRDCWNSDMPPPPTPAK